MSEQNPDARHAASPAQLLQAQRDGDIAKSQELATSLQLLLVVVATYFLAGSIIQSFANQTAEIWSSANIGAFSTEEFVEQTSGSLWSIGQLVVPLLLVICCVGVFSHLVQNTSFAFFRRPLFDASRLSPGHGFGRIFSWMNIVRAVAGIPKVAILILVFGISVWNSRNEFANLATLESGQLALQMLEAIFNVLVIFSGTMVALAGLDFAIEKFNFWQRNRMTDQQLRDETKMQETDPQIAQQRQQFHREIF